MLIKFTLGRPKITMNYHLQPHLYGSQARRNRVVHKGPAASGTGLTHTIDFLLVLEHQLCAYGSLVGIVYGSTLVLQCAHA